MSQNLLYALDPSSGQDKKIREDLQTTYGKPWAIQNDNVLGGFPVCVR